MAQFGNVKLGVSSKVSPVRSGISGLIVRSLRLGVQFLIRLPHLVKQMPTLSRFYRVLRTGTRQDLPVDGDERSWAYGLTLGHHRVVVAFNRAPYPVQRRIGLASLGVSDGTLLEGIAHESRAITRDGAIDVFLAGNTVRAFMG